MIVAAPTLRLSVTPAATKPEAAAALADASETFTMAFVNGGGSFPGVPKQAVNLGAAENLLRSGADATESALPEFTKAAEAAGPAAPATGVIPGVGVHSDSVANVLAILRDAPAGARALADAIAAKGEDAMTDASGSALSSWIVAAADGAGLLQG